MLAGMHGRLTRRGRGEGTRERGGVTDMGRKVSCEMVDCDLWRRRRRRIGILTFFRREFYVYVNTVITSHHITHC